MDTTLPLGVGWFHIKEQEGIMVSSIKVVEVKKTVAINLTNLQPLHVEILRNLVFDAQEHRTLSNRERVAVNELAHVLDKAMSIEIGTETTSE